MDFVTCNNQPLHLGSYQICRFYASFHKKARRGKSHGGSISYAPVTKVAEDILGVCKVTRPIFVPET